jgi:plastocyanin
MDIKATIVNIVEGSVFPDNEIFYDPTTITIKQGEKVTWINHDSVLHTVISRLPEQENAGLLFDSKNMGPGASFEYIFDKAGKFDYCCTLHPWMIGSVIVK